MQFAKLAFAATAALSSALSVAAFVVPATEARAVGSTSGDLNSGGVVTGDISTQAGESDVITADLVAGSDVDVTFSAAFQARVVVSDPLGAPVDTGFTEGRSFRLRSFTVPATGTWTFTVSSADGSQGNYTLVVKPKWAKTMAVAGTGQETFEFTMPANGSVSAVITRERNAPGQPQIVGLYEPGGANLLTGTLQPVKNTVKLPVTQTTTNGTYQLTVTSTDGTSGWKGVVKRSVPKVPPTRLKLANGIDAISYSQDGIDQIFSRRCGSCHFWANGFPGVRSYASLSLGRIKSGSMPPDGRLPNDQIQLIQAWIGTGRQK
jgi:hypothetical protein